MCGDCSKGIVAHRMCTSPCVSDHVYEDVSAAVLFWIGARGLSVHELHTVRLMLQWFEMLLCG